MTLFSKGMKKISNSGKLDPELEQIISDSNQQSQLALVTEAKEHEKFKQFLQLQNSITKSAEKYLTDSTTTYQKFQQVLKNPSKTAFGRMAKTLTFGLYKPKHTPSSVANLLFDLYTNQLAHAQAVDVSLKLLENRKGLIEQTAKEAAIAIRDHSKAYALIDKEKQKLETLYSIMEEAVANPENLNLEQVKQHLLLCAESGLFNGVKDFNAYEIVERIHAGENIRPDLYLIKVDVGTAHNEYQKQTRREGLEVKGGITLLKGLDLQQEQFYETINGLDLQVNELEVDLEYTKHLARNTYYLTKAQAVSEDALKSFEAYRTVMNEAQVFNSVGARLMLDRVGYLLVTPFFEEEKLEQAKHELKEAVTLFKENDKKFHDGVQQLIRDLNIEDKPYKQ